MTMQGAYLEIIRSDGRVDRHPFAAERITVGSDATAEIALADAPELEPLHLLLAPREDGCWVSVARTARVPARQAGVDFENGLVSWGAELDIGTVTFRLARAEVHPSRRRRLAGPLRKGALALACLWVASRVLGGSGPSITRSPVPPTALFADGAETCPDAGADARAHAHEVLEAAQAKSERYPFSPRDGVRAVELQTLGAECLAAAGDVADATAARGERDRLQGRVNDDYHMHRLRLDRALDHKHYEAALAEIRLIADLLYGRDDEYTRWLARIDRALVARLGKEKKR